MGFWIRIFVIILRNFRAKKQSSLAPNRTILRVWPHESEVSFANQAAYAHYLELARWDWAMKSGVVHFMRRQKTLFAVGGLLQTFRKPLRRFQKFEVKSQIVGWDEKWIYFEQSMLSEGGLIHRAYVKLIYRKGRTVIAPVEFLKSLGFADLPAQTVPRLVRQWVELENQMAGGK